MSETTVTVHKHGYSVQVKGKDAKEVWEEVGFWQGLPDVCPVDDEHVMLVAREHDNNMYYELQSKGARLIKLKVGQKKTGGLFHKRFATWREWDAGIKAERHYHPFTGEEVQVDEDGNIKGAPREARPQAQQKESEDDEVLNKDQFGKLVQRFEKADVHPSRRVKVAAAILKDESVDSLKNLSVEEGRRVVAGLNRIVKGELTVAELLGEAEEFPPEPDDQDF